MSNVKGLTAAELAEAVTGKVITGVREAVTTAAGSGGIDIIVADPENLEVKQRIAIYKNDAHSGKEIYIFDED